jgi:hypothetical protein
LLVQIFQISCLRYRNPMVSSKVADFSFDDALLRSFPRRAKLACEPPVRPECDEPPGFFPAVSTEDFLYGYLKIVVSQSAEYAAKPRERQFVRFEECLLSRPEISPMKSSSTVHAAHREDLEFDRHAAQFCPTLVPVHLRVVFVKFCKSESQPKGFLVFFVAFLRPHLGLG